MSERTSVCACDERGLLPIQEQSCDGSRCDERCVQARREMRERASMFQDIPNSGADAFPFRPRTRVERNSEWKLFEPLCDSCGWHGYLSDDLDQAKADAAVHQCGDDA